MDQLQLDEELGKGNYGTVKKVLHKPTNVVMAMKVIGRSVAVTQFGNEFDFIPPLPLSYLPLMRALRPGALTTRRKSD